MGDDISSLEEIICDVIEFAWETGDHRGRVGNLLSGLEHHCILLRGNLRSCWRLWRVCGNSEIPCRAPPLTVEATMGMACYMWVWDFRAAAVLTCLGFHCFLRSMEFMGIQCQHLTFSARGKRCHVTLPHTKGTSRHGGVEGVNVDDPVVVKLLRWLTARSMPDDLILGLTPIDCRTRTSKWAAVNLQALFPAQRRSNLAFPYAWQHLFQDGNRKVEEPANSSNLCEYGSLRAN